MNPLLSSRFLIVCSVALCAQLHGQTATPAAAAAPADATPRSDVVYDLSPFEVSADQDVGYLGQNTLSGSRVRTDLKDLAAAISPMTAEFISDIAATNVVEAMEYGVNARVETDDGRAAGPVADLYNNSIRDIRVRGLPGGQRTVNFFRYLGEVDSYNVERIDLSRGPNSILYGFGSPAGIISVGTKQARLEKPMYRFDLRVDSWDGWRATVDANVPVVRNVLALRAVYLHDRDSSWRAAGHKDQDRIFVAGTWRVDAKSTLRFSFEDNKMDRYVPRPFYAVDQMSLWVNAGSPSFRNFHDDWETRPVNAAGTPGNPLRNSGANQTAGVVDISGNPYVIATDYSPFAQNYRAFTKPQAPNPLENDFERGLINPKADLAANWGGGLWNQRNFQALYHRELWTNLNLELGYSRSTLDSQARDLSAWNTFGPAGDPNLFNPDGSGRTPGSYYFENRVMERLNDQLREQMRATLAWEQEFGAWGRLRLAGMTERLNSKERAQILEQFWFNGPSVTSPGAFNADPLNSVNRVYHRHYFTDTSLLNDPAYRMPPPHDLSDGIDYYDPATRTTRRIYAHLINRASGNILFYDETLTSNMLAAQFYTWRDRIVFTGGYRSDTLRHYEAPPVRDPEAVALGNVGIWVPSAPPATPNSKLSGETYTIGGVFHITQNLSVFYNTSTSTNIPGDIRVFGTDPSNPNPELLAPLRDGKTNDFGFKLDLLKSKLFVTVTRFETVAENDVGFSGFQARGDIQQIWRTLSESKALPVDEQLIADQMFNYIQRTQGYLFDSKTSGYEFEVVGQVTRNWSVSMNYSITESVRTNIAPRVRAHVDQWKPLWLKYRDWDVSQNANTPGPEITRPISDWRTPAEIRATGDFTINSDTINERIVDVESKFFDNPYAFEGKRYIGDNKHNLNLRTRYDFRDGLLKGFSAGGGVRLRTGRVAGAISEWEFLPGSEYTDTWNGRQISKVSIIETKDQALYDLMFIYSRRFMQRKLEWRLQLNINNVFNADDFIVNNTHPVSGKPVTYRYQDPRRFILTSSFIF
jgi:iron complex outermembrane recepter protein